MIDKKTISNNVQQNNVWRNLEYWFITWDCNGKYLSIYSTHILRDNTFIKRAEYWSTIACIKKGFKKAFKSSCECINV